MCKKSGYAVVVIVLGKCSKGGNSCAAVVVWVLGLGKLRPGSKGQLAVPRVASMRPTPRFHYARTLNSTVIMLQQFKTMMNL